MQFGNEKEVVDS